MYSAKLTNPVACRCNTKREIKPKGWDCTFLANCSDSRIKRKLDYTFSNAPIVLQMHSEI